MGDFALHLNRPRCDRAGCGRCAYEVTFDGFVCYVCDAADRAQYNITILRGPPEPPATTRLQAFLAAVPPVARLTMAFVYGDGWRRQCVCGRCERPWLNHGWICPVDYHRLRYLRILDGMWHRADFRPSQLTFVDWDEALLRFHEMFVDIVPWDAELLNEFAEASVRQVRQLAHGLDFFPS